MRSNFAVQYQLEADIRSLSQNDRNIQDFYSEITALWDQLAMTEDAELRSFAPYIARREVQRLVQLLMALRPEYEHCRASILHRTPLPSVDSVLHELLAEETRLKSQTEKVAQTSSASVFATGILPIPSQRNKINIKNGRDCNYCKQPGHWKNQCPELLARQKIKVLSQVIDHNSNNVVANNNPSLLHKDMDSHVVVPSLRLLHWYILLVNQVWTPLWTLLQNNFRSSLLASLCLKT